MLSRTQHEGGGKGRGEARGDPEREGGWGGEDTAYHEGIRVEGEAGEEWGRAISSPISGPGIRRVEQARRVVH